MASRVKYIWVFDILRLALEEDISPKCTKRKSYSGHLFLRCWKSVYIARNQLGYLPLGMNNSEELHKEVADTFISDL